MQEAHALAHCLPAGWITPECGGIVLGLPSSMVRATACIFDVIASPKRCMLRTMTRLLLLSPTPSALLSAARIGWFHCHRWHLPFHARGLPMPALRQVPVFLAKSRALALWTRGAPSHGGTDAPRMPA